MGSGGAADLADGEHDGTFKLVDMQHFDDQMEFQERPMVEEIYGRHYFFKQWGNDEVMRHTRIDDDLWRRVPTVSKPGTHMNLRNCVVS